MRVTEETQEMNLWHDGERGREESIVPDGEPEREMHEEPKMNLWHDGEREGLLVSDGEHEVFNSA